MLAIGFGSVAIAPGDVISILARQLFGVGEAAQGAGATSIVMELRLPRILAAILVGAALAGFLLGDEAAQHLGVDVRRERRIAVALASLATAAAVALAGLIGFVGLVVPHLVRLAVGPDPRAVLPLSAIGGALLLLLADTIARSIGVPVGVITALIGAPFLLWLLHRARTGYAL